MNIPEEIAKDYVPTVNVPECNVRLRRERKMPSYLSDYVVK